MAVRRAAFLLLLVGGYTWAAAPPPAGPLPCREAWANTPPERWAYDFAETYGDYRQRLPRRACHKAWTVLVYMAADHDDLTPEAYRDLAEMEEPFKDAAVSAASTVDADVVVELDVRQADGVRRLHMFRTPGAARAPEDIRSPVVEWRRQEDVPPAEALRAFVAWGVASYPAERYLVVVWGHGQGWRPAQANGAPVRWQREGLDGGLAFDESQGTVLDTPSLRQALEAAGRPPDVYVSDACLMQSVEVASELGLATRYVVGSEQVEDYGGLSYRSILPRVNGTVALPSPPTKCPADDLACRVAYLLPELQHKAFPAGAKGLETFTLSALDAHAFAKRVPAATGRLSSAISAWLREDPLRQIDLQELLEVEDPSGGGMPGFLGAHRDFGVFLARLSGLAAQSSTPATQSLSHAIRDTRQALEGAVISARLGSRYDAPVHDGKLGVSLWLPVRADQYRARAAWFGSSPFARAGGATWLAQVFAPQR